MANCPNCGNRVSITDKRCSRCGAKLNFAPKLESDKHYLEFALSALGVVFSLLSFHNTLLVFTAASIILAVIATATIRTYARSGAVILVFAVIFQALAGGISLGLVFYASAIAVAFFRS